MPYNADYDLTGSLTAAVDRSELVKKQLRDKKGRWVEMGHLGKWANSAGKLFNGIVAGIDGEYAVMSDVKSADGKHSFAGKHKVHYTQLEMIDQKADLDDIGEPGPTKHHDAPEAKTPAGSSAPIQEPDYYGFDKPKDWEFQG
jgi:hypothetical protein